MCDEIKKSKSLITFLKGKLHALWQEVRQFLSFFDFIRFCRYIATIDEWKERELSIKNERKLNFFSTTIWQHGETKQGHCYQSL